MKKILLLGGSTQQIPAISYANKQGYYTILCDYLVDNPGQNYADKFYCVSTTDKRAILEVAENEKVDGVLAYASDPAASTAAYVSEILHLPSNPYESVNILSYKDKFRKFLIENKFNCPKALSFNNFEQAELEIHNYRFPVMIKPVDSSGSKGVSKLESLEGFKSAFDNALNNSREKIVIIEEFICRDHKYMIGGDCFVLDGKVEFWGLLNCHRDFNVNPLVPVGKSYPVQISKNRIKKIHSTIQRLIDLLSIEFGGFNLEIMFDKYDNLYLIEMGPRNGGNMIPDLLNMITGVDMVAASVEAALGNNFIDLQANNKELYFATYNLHSSVNGIFKGVLFNKNLETKVVKKVIYKKEGDEVQYFDGANKAIGIVFFKFDSNEQMFELMENADRLINIIVE